MCIFLKLRNSKGDVCHRIGIVNFCVTWVELLCVLSKSRRSPFNACPVQDKLRCEIMTSPMKRTANFTKRRLTISKKINYKFGVTFIT